MIGIIQTGAGNVGSVRRAFERLGVPTRPVSTSEDLGAVDGLVLPGAGAAPAGITALREHGLAEPLRCWQKPFLGICLGMQLMFDESEEGPTECLGVIGGRVRALPETVSRPHIGWNRLSTGDHGYFVHGFACRPADPAIVTMTTWHGGPVCAGVRLRNFEGVQWHPEKSGEAGDRLLRAFADRCAGRDAAATGPSALMVGDRDGLAVRVIPCLDVAGGRVVKGTRFDDLRDAGDPVELARRYCNAGADELVFLDITATAEARQTLAELAGRVADAVNIPFTVGGGVRTVADAARLLDAGADKVAVNSAAVARPDLITEMATQLGQANTVCAIDARRSGPGWTVLTRGGRDDSGRDAVAWAREAVSRGAGELLVTSHDRDGTGLGFDTDLLARIREVVRVPVIASGGAGSPESFVAAVRDGGASAVLAASVFHQGTLAVRDVKAALAGAAFPVRL